MFNTRQAMQTGRHSFVYQFRGLESHRGSNKGIITIYPPYSVCSEEVPRAIKTSAPSKQSTMLMDLEQTHHC